jgi:23S rRNA (cytosine1962-C5)-methyltransferase
VTTPAPVSGRLVLGPRRDRSLRRRHPWVFSGAVLTVEGAPAPGDTVDVVAADGAWLARAAYSPASPIRARVWSFDPDDVIDDAFVTRRLAQSVAARGPDAGRERAGVRLVFAEIDGLPGVVVDRYGPVAVVQLTTVGADRWRDALVDAVSGLAGVDAVVERSDVDARGREGLAPADGVLVGQVPEGLEIDEGGLWFGCDPLGGHKTGFYLDQRDGRALVRSLAEGRRVLDVFAYTGGLTVAALAGGAAAAEAVDSSGPALAGAAANLARNGLQPRASLVKADAFADLRRRRKTGERWDLICLDPPKLAPTSSHVERASRAYKDLNLQAFGLLAPGGLLLTWSCSGAVDAALFQKIVAGAALDAGRDIQIVGHLAQPADHPVLLSFPEAAYLTGLVCRAPA